MENNKRDTPKDLKDLILGGYVKIAELPEKNNFTVGDLDKYEAYVLLLIAHDYGAKSPVMWNSVYESKGLDIRYITIVVDPKKDSKIVIDALKADSKCLGFGFGVGWKERMDLVDKVVPENLSSINNIIKDNGMLVARNTDAVGFVKRLEEEFGKVGKKVEESNFVVFGAGGVAKEVVRLIASKGAKYIAILNRTKSRAVELAYQLNRAYGDVAFGAGEEVIQGCLLNSFVVPDAVINLTDKGSDGFLVEYSAFAKADLKSLDGKGNNITIAKMVAREMKNLNPNVIIADIVLPKGGISKTLAVAKNEGLEYLVDGLGMVVYQAVPAYLKVQELNPEKHKVKVSETELLDMFKEAAGFGK